MTNCFKFMVQANKNTDFKTLKLNYNAEGMEATLQDKEDGQLYKVEIKPLYITEKVECAATQ